MIARAPLATRRAVAVRSTPTDAPAAPAAKAMPAAGTVFYRGVAYENEAAFQAAVASGAADNVVDVPVVETPSLTGA